MSGPAVSAVDTERVELNKFTELVRGRQTSVSQCVKGAASGQRVVTMALLVKGSKGSTCQQAPSK